MILKNNKEKCKTKEQKSNQINQNLDYLTIICDTMELGCHLGVDEDK